MKSFVDFTVDQQRPDATNLFFFQEVCAWPTQTGNRGMKGNSKNKYKPTTQRRFFTPRDSGAFAVTVLKHAGGTVNNQDAGRNSCM